MAIGDLFKGKTDAEIEDLMNDLSGKELIKIGCSIKDKNIIKFGIEKANTRIWALDYIEGTIDFFDNMVNLKSIWELIRFDEERYVELRNILTGKEDTYSLSFFGDRFEPIYKDNKHITIMTKTLNEINKILWEEKQ